MTEQKSQKPRTGMPKASENRTSPLRLILLFVTGAIALFVSSKIWLFQELAPESGAIESKAVNSMKVFQEYLLFTSELERAIAEVESLGGRVTHRLGKRIFVAHLTTGVDPQALAAASPDPPPELDETEQLVISAWRAKGAKHDVEEMHENENRKWDAPGYESPEYDSPESN